METTETAGRRTDRKPPWAVAALAVLAVLASGCVLRASATHGPPDVAKLPHTTLGALMFVPRQGSTGVALDQPVLVQSPYSDASIVSVTVMDAAGHSLAGSLNQRTWSLGGGLQPDSHYVVTATVSVPNDGQPGSSQQTQTLSFSTVTTPQITSVTPTALAPAQAAVAFLDSPASDVKVDGPATGSLNPGGLSVNLSPVGYRPGNAYDVTVTLTGLDGTVGAGHPVHLVSLGGPKVSSSPSNGSTNLGVGIPLIVSVTKPPADPAAFAARLSVAAGVTPTVAGPDALPGLARLSPSGPTGTCTSYLPSPQGGGTIPTSARWLSSTKLQFVPRTPDGYWPPDAAVHVSGVVDGLAATDGSQFTGSVDSSFTTGDKRVIDVDLSSQTLTACRNGSQANQFLVSTGTIGKETATGHYTIYERVLSAEMKGGGVGPSAPGYYDVKNVPYTQYFNGGDALHGAWWHNNFGHPMSHGCVNVSTPTHNASWPHAAPDAEWLWSFDAIGDPVIVHGVTP